MARLVATKPWLLRAIGGQIQEVDLDFLDDGYLYTYTATISAWRDLLERAALLLWGGREGRDWRIVQDQTVFGFHAMRVADGEAIELR